MKKELDKDSIQVVFNSQNQFRMLAPESVAKGMLAICQDPDDETEQRQNAADIMDLISESVPRKTIETTTSTGKTTTTSSPLYNPIFSETMIKEIQARYKEISVVAAHEKRMKAVKEFLRTYKPTITLGEALYRLSFYLIPSYNNLAKSTNHLIAFAKNILLDNRNNMLVDSAILLGGQGKSTVQTGLKRATEIMGFGATMCHLPNMKDGVQDVYVRNEICIDDESRFERLDLDSLNKILDKSTITIKGKYIKEWSARSIANVFVGTNFLPTDVNARRYSVRMADENFKLEQNYGRWDIPGNQGDLYGDSYSRVVDWTTEGWLNLFYYCNKYKIKELSYEEKSFDYSLIYQLQKALEVHGSNVGTVHEIVRAMESVNGNVFDEKTKQNYKNKLYMLANQLKLEILGEKKHNIYNTYNWEKAIEIDEATMADPLERIYCFFMNNEAFKVETDEQFENQTQLPSKSIFSDIEDWVSQKEAHLHNLDDNTLLVKDLEVPEVFIHGLYSNQDLKFQELSLKDVKVRVFDIKPDKVSFIFDNILFKSVLSLDSKELKFEETEMHDYLSKTFSNSLKECLGVENIKVDLLDAESAMKGFFKSAKDRLKTSIDDESTSCSWWLKSKGGGSGDTQYFKAVGRDTSIKDYKQLETHGICPVFEITV